MSAAEEHRSIAGTFGDKVRGVGAGGWDAATPVAQWQARDVVRHLVEWFPAFLADGSDLRLTPGPSVDDDPVAAWEHHATGVQAVLDDPANADLTFAHPRLPAMPLPRAISEFYTGDVFMHTWDLARATGQDDRLDEERCQVMFTGMEPMDEMLRQSGQYGARVAVPEDASWQDRLIGFIGRDPQWRP
ncbi:TIGR03086 family metal-binding protein [Pimelobacter simplex]|uniref:TIGR03086 family metal-binding protein n=1 Tax=Nocardioides simplex TaxID=2045 RepID=UPI00214F9DE4|nr:TIGR03086 family metal-binding protein [Pimelobacter simplex]UUW88547.1 TIGR03086 family metal-binding protein [Pimelobacter simplex]UUW98052.1 TIGR03086 family metal-binding protein [Pimelobacter simplex]